MALSTRQDTSKSVIHHSDRGVQYCSKGYVDRLRKSNVLISMTHSGDPNENALAERVFRSLKEDFKLTGFTTYERAKAGVERAIKAYNSLRPHASLDYKTPNEVHKQTGYQRIRWYPYKKVRHGNVQYYPDNEAPTPPVNSFQ